MQAQPEITTEASNEPSTMTVSSSIIQPPKLNRSQQRRIDKQIRKQVKLQLKQQTQLHLFLDQDAVRMLNFIHDTLDVDPREFIRSVIPVHYRRIKQMKEQREAELRAEADAALIATESPTPEPAAEVVGDPLD